MPLNNKQVSWLYLQQGVNNPLPTPRSGLFMTLNSIYLLYIGVENVLSPTI